MPAIKRENKWRAPNGGSMNYKMPVIDVFDTGEEPKGQAMKVMEEAAELVEAVKEGDEEHMRYEAMDVLQALANFCAGLGWSFNELLQAYGQVHKANVERGRY